MPQENKPVEFLYTVIGPTLMLIVGWFVSNTLTEIKQDVKILLETNATLREKVFQLESKIERMEKKCMLPQASSLIFDKTRRLVLTENGFTYV